MIFPAVLAAASTFALISALPQGFPNPNAGDASALPSVSTASILASASFSSVGSVASAVPSAIPATGPYAGGDLTWYTPGEMNNTACGPKHADTDPIAALPQAFFDGYPGATANPNDSPLCGKDIIISASATPGGPLLTARATVSDICGDCNITTSVDVTPVVFTQFTDQLAGRLHNISWDFASAANATSESVGLASMDVSTSARPTTMAPVGRSSRSRRGRH